MGDTVLCKKPESFMEMYLGMLEGLINAYRILLAIKEGKDSVKLINTERGEQVG